MNIIIDSREKDLIELFNKNNKTITTKNLEVGDCHIIKDDKCKLIIERKHVNDLASSIQDGRYREQAFRLDQSTLNNHQIFYVIEGSIQNYNNKYSKINKSALYSSLLSLSYFKGFSIFKTSNTLETYELIVSWSNKINKETKLAYNSDLKQQNYTECIKIKKKKEITNKLDEIMLMQIPGVSNTIASLLINKYNSIFNLLTQLHNNPDLLNNVKYKTSTNKERKISKTIITQLKNLTV